MATGLQTKSKHRYVTEMSADQATTFFLKQESYCTFDLPPYFRFEGVLHNVAAVLDGKTLSELSKSPRNYDSVNHQILNNKDGRFAWRPLELIHPALYVSLVHHIAEPSSWGQVLSKFQEFAKLEQIECLGIPVESLTQESDKAEQVSSWWQNVEQRSLELSIDYAFLIHTDLVDCYPSIYTHSIAWALHTKALAKKQRNDKSLLGNVIDSHIQDMRQGQTNGIPQGSALMDLVGELVLGYADVELACKAESMGLDDFHILRYRDDYRIFTNSLETAERILKCLTEVMVELGLKLNPVKTKISNEVIPSSLKADKLAWMLRDRQQENLQKRLLTIHAHSLEYPNSGSIVVALQDYFKDLSKSDRCPYPLSSVGIMVDIAFRNPRTYPIAVAVVSKLISFLDDQCNKQDVIKRILRKFAAIPNTDQMQIWLQRVSRGLHVINDFDAPLCMLVSQQDQTIWNDDWITSIQLRRSLDTGIIVDREQLESIDSVIQLEEVELFKSEY